MRYTFVRPILETTLAGMTAYATAKPVPMVGLIEISGGRATC